jgi:hypothetical protein
MPYRKRKWKVSGLSLDDLAQMAGVGSRNWIEASKNMQVRGYLPSASNVDISAEPIEYHMEDESNPRHDEDFDRLPEGITRSSE